MEDKKIYVVTFEDKVEEEIDSGVYGEEVYESIDDAIQIIVDSILFEYSGCTIAETPEEELKSRIKRDRNITFDNGMGNKYSYYIHVMRLITKGGNCDDNK